jgi:hypothetical protein
MDRPWKGLVVLIHIGEQLSGNLVIQLVHHIIPFTNRTIQLGVMVHKGAEDVLDHGLGDLSHYGDIDTRFEVRFLDSRRSPARRY